MTRAAPDLSIVVASTLPWPALRGCLDSLYSQARACNAELIVAVRDTGPPEEAYSGIVLITEPRGTLFSLRAAGFAVAKGRIVALTEDHCHARPNWCESVIEAHRRRPEAAIIGCVENTARNRISEWAVYLLGNGAFMQPLETGTYAGGLTSANSSFKRAALPARFPEAGWDGGWCERWLRDRGDEVIVDPAPVVDHHLLLSMRAAMRVFYLSARCSAEPDLPLRRVVPRALVGCLSIPTHALRVGLRIAIRKGRFRATAIASIPAIALLLAAHHWGAARAGLGGRGDAPELLH